MKFCILNMLFFLNILFPCTVFTLLITGALHWRSSDNKSTQYSSNLLSIVIVFNNALFWIVPNSSLNFVFIQFFFSHGPHSQLFNNDWCDSQSYISQLLLHSGRSSYLFFFKFYSFLPCFYSC